MCVCVCVCWGGGGGKTTHPLPHRRIAHGKVCVLGWGGVGEVVSMEDDGLNG